MWCHFSLSPPLRVCASVFLPPPLSPPLLLHASVPLPPPPPPSFSLPFCLSFSFSVFQFIRAPLGASKIIHWHGSNNAVMGWGFCPESVFSCPGPWCSHLHLGYLWVWHSHCWDWWRYRHLFFHTSILPSSSQNRFELDRILKSISYNKLPLKTWEENTEGMQETTAS